jgi:MFS transporter, SP family, xylose:H+ symportor
MIPSGTGKPALSLQPSAQPESRTYVVWIAITAALGGLLFGYDWVVIGGARQFYEQYFHLSSAALVGWANSCALVGCLAGSIAAGSLTFRYGRRRILLLSAILFAVSSGLTGWAQSFTQFIVWRIAGGVAIGLSSNVSPLYIAEVSPAAVRGRLVSLNQFAIVVGILMAQVVNWLIARPVAPELDPDVAFASWNVQYGWRWMFTAVIAPSLVFTLASLFLPESPRWLLMRNREREARDVLERVGGPAYAQAEVDAIEQALRLDDSSRSSVRELLAPAIRRMLLIGIALAALQQWTGINVIFNYAGEVYRNAGHGASDIFLDIIVTGVINLVFTILAMALVDRVGRRPLMIFGCMGIAVAHLLCALAYRAGWRTGTVLTLTLSAIACYALTLAPVTWVLIAEIFPNRVRSQAISLCVGALWTASFLLTYSFPSLNKAFGTGGAFLTYGLICVAGCLLCAGFVPETKGRSLEQIEIESATARSSTTRS